MTLSDDTIAIIKIISITLTLCTVVFFIWFQFSSFMNKLYIIPSDKKRQKFWTKEIKDGDQNYFFLCYDAYWGDMKMEKKVLKDESKSELGGDNYLEFKNFKEAEEKAQLLAKQALSEQDQSSLLIYNLISCN
jgi:hypothetical protein